MKRSTAREIAMRLTFSSAMNEGAPEETLNNFFEREYYDTLSAEDEFYSEYPNKKQMEYIRRLVLGVTEHGAELDSYIEKYSKDWKFSRISRVAAAIMRIAMFEMLYMSNDVPVGVAVNEAVEMSKGYEERDTVAFVNGILGTFAAKELAQNE
jgi:transcription antitermination protein NusB